MPPFQLSRARSHMKKDGMTSMPEDLELLSRYRHSQVDGRQLNIFAAKVVIGQEQLVRMYGRVRPIKSYNILALRLLAVPA